MQQGQKQLSDEMQHSLNEAAILYPDLSQEKLLEIASRLSGIPEFMFNWMKEIYD